MVPTTSIVGVLDPVTGFVALRFRFKVHITGNPFNVNFGPNCYIGTDAAPIDLNTLTTAADFGAPYTKNGEATLANSTFAVPGATGCQRGLRSTRTSSSTPRWACPPRQDSTRHDSRARRHRRSLGLSTP